MFIMPRTSVSPAANRNSINPYCSPLRPWVRSSGALISTMDRPRKPARRRRRSLHWTGGVISVLIVLEDDAAIGFNGVPVRGLDDLRRVEILDGEVVVVI